jgi:hypothetical protein
VLALLLVPLALVAAGRRWAAYVLGGTAALAVLSLVPPLFESFADALSLSQAVRLGSFLPLPFAFAGAALLAGRARLAGVAAALFAALGFELAFPAEATGAAWAVWLAALGATCGLAIFGFVRAPSLEAARGRWAVLAAVALTAPVAAHGLSNLERWDAPDPYGLTPGLTHALDYEVPPLSVVLAPSVTSYRIAGEAPVRIVVAPPGHVAFAPGHAAFNTDEDYVARSRAARLFFLEPSTPASERAAILRRYDVSWVVVDKTRGQTELPTGLTRIYEDGRYALYRVGKEGA